MKKPLVSVLVLTYNRTDLLKTCLDSVLESDYPNIEFVVSDNGSSENITEFVKRNYSKNKIKVVRLEQNKGLTGGFNFGFKFCQGKYIMILSNDTKIAKDAITQMVNLTEKDSLIGIVSPKIIQMKNPTKLHNVGSFMTYSGLLYHYGLLQNIDDNPYQRNYYVFSCNGSGFLIRKEAAKQSGLFEEDFFVYYDESDLSHRIWLSGYTVVYCAKASIWHLWGATMGAGPDIWYYNHRNHLSSYLRNLSLPYLVLLIINFNLMLILWFLINIIKLKFEMSLALPKAYVWHLWHISETLKKRKFIQTKIRKVSDRQIFEKCLVSPGWKYYLIYMGGKYQDKKLPQRVAYT